MFIHTCLGNKEFSYFAGIDRERCELPCLTTAKVVLDQYQTKYENSFFPKQVCINAIYGNIFLELALRSIKQRLSLKNIHYITMATLLKRQGHFQRKNNK